MNEKTRWQSINAASGHLLLHIGRNWIYSVVSSLGFDPTIMLYVTPTKFCFLLFGHHANISAYCTPQKNASLKFCVQNSTLILPEYMQLCMLRYIRKQRLSHTCMKIEITKALSIYHSNSNSM